MSNRKHLASNIRFPWNNIMKTVTAISFDFFSCLHPLLCMISNEIGWKRWRVVGNKLASACITHDGAIRPSILILLAYIYKFYFSSFNSYIYILSLCCALSTAVAAGGSEKLLELAAARTTSRQRQKKTQYIKTHYTWDRFWDEKQIDVRVCVGATCVSGSGYVPICMKNIIRTWKSALLDIAIAHTHTQAVSISALYYPRLSQCGSPNSRYNEMTHICGSIYSARSASPHPHDGFKYALLHTIYNSDI